MGKPKKNKKTIMSTIWWLLGVIVFGTLTGSIVGSFVSGFTTQKTIAGIASIIILFLLIRNNKFKKK